MCTLLGDAKLQDDKPALEQWHAACRSSSGAQCPGSCGLVCRRAAERLKEQPRWVCAAARSRFGVHHLVCFVVPLWVDRDEGIPLVEVEVLQNGVCPKLFTPLDIVCPHGFGAFEVVLPGPQESPQAVLVCTSSCDELMSRTSAALSGACAAESDRSQGRRLCCSCRACVMVGRRCCSPVLGSSSPSAFSCDLN